MMFPQQWIKCTRSDSVDELTYFWCGWLCLFVHPLFWVALTHWFPQPYESPIFRFFCAVLSIPITLLRHWPEKIKRLFPVYWFLFLMFQLPAFTTYSLLQNNFSDLWLIIQMGGLIFLAIFYPCLILFLANLLLGIGFAYWLYFFTKGHHLVWDQSYTSYVVLFSFCVFVTSFFSHMMKQQAIKDTKKTLKALAGSIAHEMRNPLAQVHGNLNLMQQQIPLLGSAKPVIAYHINSAQKVIHNALQVIDITMGAIREKPVDVANFKLLCAKTLVAEAVADYAYEEIVHASRLSIKGESFELMAEAVMVKYILYNLIKNALYYVKTLPDARIIITLMPNVDGVNCIEVRDTGPGIPPDIIPKLFDSFYTSGNQGGTGLGLFYCKRSMKALGGDIHCDSQLDQYTAFTLSFPKLSAQQVAIAQEEKPVSQGSNQGCNANRLPSEPTSLRGKVVLIAEDDMYGRRLVKMALEKQGVHCLEAENGQQALELLAIKHCDLVLSDMQMPLICGLELVQIVRKRQREFDDVNIPIIVLTAEEGSMINTALQLGANDYLIKPIAAEKLVPKLQQWLLD